MANNIYTTANKPVGHNGRNGFDLSSSHAFCARPGVTRPVVCIDTVPDSAYRITASDIVRTQSLQTAAFMAGRHELDFYFVPYNLVYSGANKVVLGKDDTLNVMQDYVDTTGEFPKARLAHLFENAAFCYAAAMTFKHIEGLPSQDPWFLPEYSGFYYLRLWINDYLSLMNEDSYSMTDEQYASCINAITYNQFSSVPNNFNPGAVNFVGSDILGLLSSLGYGDFYLLVRTWVLGCFDAVPTEQTPHAEDYVYAWCKAFTDQLSLFLSTYFTGSSDPYVNLSRLAAYQKIWYDQYRDSINDNGVDLKLSLTLDTQFSSSFRDLPFYQAFDILPSQYWYLNTYLKPRLRQYKKDLSSGLWPSTQEGKVANINATEADRNILSSLNVPVQGSSGSIKADSAYAVKFTLALQKYREMLMRAGNRTKDLLTAEFGVKSMYISHHYVHYIGSYSGDLSINKVDATAQQGDYSVGDLAANVFTSLKCDSEQGYLEFTANDYGMIIGVMSFIPEVLHNSFGIDPFVHKFGHFDFYHPAFENMGLQPVDSKIFFPWLSNSLTLGYGARYNEYKQKLDFAHDNFNTGMLIPAYGQSLFVTKPGTNSNYVVVKPVDQDISVINNRSYVLPSVMDSIFTELDGPDFDNYHFHVALNVGVSAILPMSVTGML